MSWLILWRPLPYVLDFFLLDYPCILIANNFSQLTSASQATPNNHRNYFMGNFSNALRRPGQEERGIDPGRATQLTAWRATNPPGDKVTPRYIQCDFFPRHIFRTPSNPYATKAARKAHYAKNLIISKSNGSRGRAARLAYGSEISAAATAKKISHNCCAIKLIWRRPIRPPSCVPWYPACRDTYNRVIFCSRVTHASPPLTLISVRLLIMSNSPPKNISIWDVSMRYDKYVGRQDTAWVTKIFVVLLMKIVS